MKTIAESQSGTVRVGSFQVDSLGQRLRKLRRRSGMSVWELAEATGISGGYVSLIENDRVRPSSDALRWIEQALGASEGTLTRIAALLQTPDYIVSLIPETTLKEFLNLEPQRA